MMPLDEILSSSRSKMSLIVSADEEVPCKSKHSSSNSSPSKFKRIDEFASFSSLQEKLSRQSRISINALTGKHEVLNRAPETGSSSQMFCQCQHPMMARNTPPSSHRCKKSAKSTKPFKTPVTPSKTVVKPAEELEIDDHVDA